MLEGHLVSLQSTIRSQQVYNHIKAKYDLWQKWQLNLPLRNNHWQEFSSQMIKNWQM
jgi:hypothetical protein